MREIAWVYSEALQGELCIQNIKELVQVAQGGDEGQEGWTRLSNIEGVSMYTSEVESIVSIKTEAVVNVSPELTWRLVQDPELRAAWDPMVQVRMRTAGGVSKVFLNRLFSGMDPGILWCR
jgi:hypothetical protein